MALTALLLGGLWQPASAEIGIELDSMGLTLSGPASATLFVAHVSRLPSGLSFTALSNSALVTTDIGGEAYWAPDDGVPEQSLWFASDRDTGLGTWVWPEESELEAMDLSPSDVLPLDADGNRTQLLLAGRITQAWVLRPGFGIWSLRGADGGEDDAGPPNDHLVLLDVQNAEILHETQESLLQIEDGDVILAADTGSLSYFVTTAGE